MAQFKTWIKAARPRTVLLSFSGVLLGSFLAFDQLKPLSPSKDRPYFVILFAALTAILLQILSNLANDYGDFEKGTDGAKRIGIFRQGLRHARRPFFGDRIVVLVGERLRLQQLAAQGRRQRSDTFGTLVFLSRPALPRFFGNG